MPRWLAAIAPACVAVIAVFTFAWLGPTNPLGLAILGPCLALGLVLIAQSAPVLLFWAMPLSMAWSVNHPLMQYEAIALLVAAFMFLQAPPTSGLDRIRIPQIELRYLAFLLAILPGYFVAISPWHFFGALKVFVIGLLAFEGARRGARRLGHEALLWGPAMFIAVSSIMLAARIATSGVPGFKGSVLRGYLTELPWGTSNFVAAVMVLCLPVLALLVREAPRGSRRHALSLTTLVGTMAALLLTGSRGGFLLAVVYLLLLAGGARRSLVLILTTVAALTAALALTPVGHALVARFVDAKSWVSVDLRILVWKGSLERGWAHLPLGVGAGQGVIQDDRLQALDPHNFLLTLFSEVGPIALVIWLWLFARLWRESQDMGRSPLTRPIGEACLGTIALAFFNMQFEPTMKSSLYHLLFWWNLGILFGGADRLRSSPALPAPPLPRAPLEDVGPQ